MKKKNILGVSYYCVIVPVSLWEKCRTASFVHVRETVINSRSNVKQGNVH